MRISAACTSDHAGWRPSAPSRRPALLLFATLTLLATLLATPARAADPTLDMTTEVVTLQHRLAEDLIPMLRELVAPGGTVTGMAERLVLRTTPANLAELKGVLASFDTRARQVRITVSQGLSAAAARQQQGLAAHYADGSLAAQVGTVTPAPGATVGIGGGNARVTVQAYATQGADDRVASHFVTTLEGSPAWIDTGADVPLPSQSAVLTPWGASLQQSLEYRHVGTGFYVTPRVQGDQVQLEISPYAEQAASRGGGEIAVHGLSTFASGPLGSWIPLGGAQQSYATTGAAPLASTRRHDTRGYDVWVKVDIVP